MSLLSPILPRDSEGVKFAKLQRQLRAAADAAGITYTMSGYLNDILPRETEGVKWAKLGAWATLIAQNISGGGGGGVSKIIAGTGISVSPLTGLGDVTVSATGGGSNSDASATNTTGNTTITPTSANETVRLLINGVARTSNLILDVAGRTAGDTLRLVITLPATLAIILQVRNATVAGTQLLPASTYASNQYSTDGVDLSATWDFEFTGTAWIWATGKIPA